MILSVSDSYEFVTDAAALFITNVSANTVY